MSEMCVSKGLDDYGDLLDKTEHRWRRRLIGLLMVAAVVAGGVYALWAMVLSGGGLATAAVQTATVTTGSISKTVSTTGTVVAQSTTNLSFTQSGKVTAVNVGLGQDVKQGDVLAELDSTSLQQALTTAEVGLSSAQTRLNQLLEGSTASELASADQSLVQAQANYDEAVRALQDLQAGPTASEQLSAQQAVTSAQAQLDQAKLALSDLTAALSASEELAAQQGVTSAQAQLDQANRALADLTAPPSASDELTAQQGVTSAQNALNNAQNTATNAASSLTSAGLALTAEETAYCGIDSTLSPPTSPSFCTAQAEPISSTDEQNLLNIRATGQPPELATHAASVLAANTSYKSAKATNDSAGAAITSAQQALQAANAKLAELNAGPTASEVANAQEAVTAAQGGLAVAQAKLTELNAGPTASDKEKAQEAVVTAASGLASAQAKLDEVNAGATPSDLAKAQDAVNTAAAALAATQAKHDETYAGSMPEDIQLQRDQVALAQLSVAAAQKNLDGAKLIAPYDGTVAALNIAVGDMAGASSTTAPIILNTPNAVHLNLTVTESDLPSVKVGESGIATFDALSGSVFPIVIDAVGTNPTTTQGVVTYQAQAHFVSGAAVGATGASSLSTTGGSQSSLGGAAGSSATPKAGTPVAGATSSTGAGTAQGTTAGETSPLPGMNATVTIIVEQAQNVLTVPDRAIQTQGGNSVVEVRKDDGSTEMVVVQTGLSDGTNTEITAGLEEGQTVILPSRTTTSTTAQATSVAGTQQGGLQFGSAPFEGGAGGPP
jgi:multidrug efflux pump subunit AcrA (membrane-fusion protein)